MVSPEWQMAREWLIGSGVVPANSKILSPECDLFDFAQSLRDGVLLCQVANYLKEGAVRDVNLTTHMSPFLCMKNIKGFLRACSDIFRVGSRDLFSANDLYDVSDFEKVINTLSVLSKTADAKSLHLISFPPADHHYAEEDIYSNLGDTLSMRRYDDPGRESIYDVVNIPENEKIYEDIVQCTNKLSQMRKATQADKRTHVVNELIQTEENYINALKVMIEAFIKQLEHHMPMEDKEKIFMNTPLLYTMHCRFMRDLNPGNRGLKVGSFVQYKLEFLKYSKYCAGMQEAQQRVTELCKDATMNQRIEDCSKKAGRKFPLSEQLVVPFQRILKYPLLLKVLNNQTPPGHPEKPAIEMAIATMEDVANYINAYVRDGEVMRTITKIEASVKDDIQRFNKEFQFGRYVKDGEIQVIFEKKEKKKRYAFLFEKSLILCRARGDYYDMKEVIDLKKYVIDPSTAPQGKGKFSFAWSIQAKTADGATESNNCIMCAKTATEKELWTGDIQRCIDMVTLSQIKSTMGHTFDLTSFPDNCSCSQCGKLLWGQLSQGYKCEVCQIGVHYDCIEKCSSCSKSTGRKISNAAPYERAVFGNQQPTEDVAAMLSAFPWFIGKAPREAAQNLLQGQADGSFVVRASEKRPGEYALSVKYRDMCKHIIIAFKNHLYHLTEVKQFVTILDLIEYYKRNTLGSSFPSLNTSLIEANFQLNDSNSSPSRNMICRALYPYRSAKDEELTFDVDDRITVTNSTGNWWYGLVRGKEGYFPSNYVEVITR